MKTIAFAIALVTAGTSFGQAIRTPRHPGGPGVDEEYDQYYNQKNEITISGTVTGKVKGTPGNGKAESMSILVRTTRGKVYSIDLGPSWYIQDQAAKINMGDHVKVVGSLIAFKNHENVLLAKRIIDHRKVLAVRDNAGLPYWEAFRQGQFTLPGVNNSLTGTVVSQNPVTVQNQQQAGVQLQTDQGLVNVAMAPDWYLQQQGIGFKVGDGLTVYYGAGPARFGNMIIASGIYSPSNSGTLVLRPNGIPAWGGWRPGP